MNIYFAGAIKGGRQDAGLYQQLITHLKQYGTVLTEHLGNPNLTASGEQLSPQKIHDRDIDWVFEADVLIAEVTVPSLGVGYEIGRALEHNKPILCLFRPEEGKKLSSMILGSSGVINNQYSTLEEAYKHIDQFFSHHPIT